MKVAIGKNTLGQGEKMNVNLKTYNRSTHNLSYAWRSTMGVGSLVPFMKILGLPGDTFDINMDNMILTHPTVGPLFGNYKFQADIFTVPIRLYQAQLHNNQNNIGRYMEKVKLPKIQIWQSDNRNIKYNGSSLLNYLGIKGCRKEWTNENRKNFNATSIIGYYDICKNYYLNKQEPTFYILRKGAGKITNVKTINGDAENCTKGTGKAEWTVENISILVWTKLNLTKDDFTKRAKFTYKNETTKQNRNMWFSKDKDYNEVTTLKREIAADGRQYYVFKTLPNRIYGMECNDVEQTNKDVYRIEFTDITFNLVTDVKGYPISEIDKTREEIYKKGNAPYLINADANVPNYLKDLLLKTTYDTNKRNQENELDGLCLKTHQSDIFNNWINSEWIDGENGITAITAIDTSSGKFTLDTLNLSKKVYDMLNRIAVSGGTYKDWIEVQWTTDYYFRAETPVYEGGMSSTIEFQQVVSNSATEDEPLGTLAGRGVSNGKKGGTLKIKINEPCYIMGIASITPYVDYSQGQDFDMELDNMGELHVPALDGIGYQDLLARRMHWLADGAIGKQPAWLDYMTNVNKTYGNFEAKGNESFMVLNRIYEVNENNNVIENATTYINPKDYTYVFASNTNLNQDFWVQIGVGIEARRVMSAKQIPIL